MGRASPAIVGFNGGEWMPQMGARTDVQKYAVASHVQRNMLALKQGASTQRPGTAYVQPVKTQANRTWLRRFEFSQTQAFVIEFGDGYCRFYTNHGPLLVLGAAAWSNSIAYLVGNVVTLSGVLYYCSAANTNHSPPNLTYWWPMSPYPGGGWIYEIPSPYAVADLTDSAGEFALQIIQSGDVLYIAGGMALAGGGGAFGNGYPPFTLTRYSNSPPTWQFALYAPLDGPYSPGLPVVPNNNVGVYATAQQGNGVSVYLTAAGGAPYNSQFIFQGTDVGRLIRIGQQVFNVTPWQAGVAWTAGQTCTNGGNNYIALTTATSGGSGPVVTEGSQLDGPAGVRWLYTDSTYGIGQITAVDNVHFTGVTVNVLQRLPASVVGVTGTISAISQTNPCVVTLSVALATAPAAGTPVFIVAAGGMTQINQNVYTVQTATTTQITLAGLDSTTFSAYTSGGTLYLNSTIEWQLGAWSNTTEWPRAVAIFKDRLFLGGRLNVWGSVPGLYNSHTPDFFNQVTTDSAINILVSGSDASSINWLFGAYILLVGTQGGEYGIDAAEYSAQPLGPDNVECLRQSNWRCRAITPELVGVSLLYVQRAGRKLNAMDYNFYLNRYDSTDQTKFSYHVTIGGLQGICMQQEPWSILWSWRADGTFLSYTFNREDNVTAWCPHTAGGIINGYQPVVESMVAIPSPDGLRDEVWMIVNRGGGANRTVEYMTKQYEGPGAGYAGDAQSSSWYVDCGLTGTLTTTPGQLTTTVTGLPSVMYNQVVSVLADGANVGPCTVSNTGSITFDGAHSVVTVGFGYQANLVPMRFEGGAESGTAQAKIKKGAHLAVRVVDTNVAGVTVSQLSNMVNGLYRDPLGSPYITAVNAEPLAGNLPQTGMDTGPPLMSGDFRTSFPWAPQSEQDETDLLVLVQNTTPLPMTVAGLFPNYTVEDPA